MHMRGIQRHWSLLFALNFQLGITASIQVIFCEFQVLTYFKLSDFILIFPIQIHEVSEREFAKFSFHDMSKLTKSH